MNDPVKDNDGPQAPTGLIGTNRIVLSAEQTKAIVQHYFDTVLFRTGWSPRIKSVTANQEKSCGQTVANSFEVLTES